MPEQESNQQQPDKSDIDSDRGSESFDLVVNPPRATLDSVTLVNFRGFPDAHIELGRLTALVGPNGAGKSSVVDAFKFVSDAVELSVRTALDKRGGIRAVRHKAGSRGRGRVSLKFCLSFSNGFTAIYEIALAVKTQGSFAVAKERCVVFEDDGKIFARFLVSNGKVRALSLNPYGPLAEPPPVEPATLLLPVIGGLPGFNLVLKALSELQTYAIVPERLRELEDPDEGAMLAHDGANAASVLRHLTDGSKRDLLEMLEYIAPGVIDVETVTRIDKLSMRFKQRSNGVQPNQFDAHQMSDGTLRALGILLALFQNSKPWFLVLEEPEATVHPAALSALIEVIRSRNDETQIVITTHSPIVIDSLDVDELKLVMADNGVSTLSQPAEHSKQVIRDQLFRPGELFLAGGLVPDDDHSPVE